MSRPNIFRPNGLGKHSMLRLAPTKYPERSGAAAQSKDLRLVTPELPFLEPAIQEEASDAS